MVASDSGLVLVFNGEIYNQQELRGQLETSRGLVEEKVGKLENIQQEVQRVLDASKVWEGRAVLDVFKQSGGALPK